MVGSLNLSREQSGVVRSNIKVTHTFHPRIYICKPITERTTISDKEFFGKVFLQLYPLLKLDFFEQPVASCVEAVFFWEAARRRDYRSSNFQIQIRPLITSTRRSSLFT